MGSSSGPAPRRVRGALQITQLVTFANLAREGSFTRAAEATQMTQPAASQHVRALERHFGVRLVDLVGRQVVLTAAGAFLAERAVRILESIASSEREMRQFADAQRGELRLGTTITIGGYTLTPLLERFRARYPDVIVRVRMRNRRDIADMVKRGELELALVEGLPLDNDLTSFTYSGDELSLVAAPSHRLAKLRGPIVPEDLIGEPFIAREEGSGTRAAAETALERVGVQLNVVLELPNGEAIVRAVEAGIGMSIISSIITDRAVAEGRLRRIAIADVDLRREFQIIHLSRLTPSPAASAFIAIVNPRKK